MENILFALYAFTDSLQVELTILFMCSSMCCPDVSMCLYGTCVCFFIVGCGMIIDLRSSIVLMLSD